MKNDGNYEKQREMKGYKVKPKGKQGYAEK